VAFLLRLHFLSLPIVFFSRMTKPRQPKKFPDIASAGSLLLANMRRNINLSDKDEQLVLATCTIMSVHRKEYFHHEGEVAGHLAFVLSGCMRSYFTDTNGFEHTVQFAIEDWWITDMMSYIRQEPGRLNIDALEPTTLLLMSRKDQLQLFELCPKVEKFFRIMLEKSLASQQLRIIENLSLPATERYLNFIKRYPLLTNRISQIQIASYLGITPEFLSKIRRQLMSK
jgi:CRP-like cAMP-binding protein